MKEQLKKFRMLAVVLVAELVLTLLSPAVARTAVANAWSYLVDILLMLPMILVLMGLFDAWVPRHVVERNAGPASGIKGFAVSILLGTAAAGPLYAAFPIAQSMKNKGARLANVVIFLGTWAAVKIPMVFMEARFVGLLFALTRLVLTLPGVILIGLLMERFTPAEEATA